MSDQGIELLDLIPDNLPLERARDLGLVLVSLLRWPHASFLQIVVITTLVELVDIVQASLQDLKAVLHVDRFVSFLPRELAVHLLAATLVLVGKHLVVWRVHLDFGDSPQGVVETVVILLFPLVLVGLEVILFARGQLLVSEILDLAKI